MPDVNDKIKEAREMVDLVSNSGYLKKSDYQKDIDEGTRTNRTMNIAGKSNEDRKAFDALIKQLNNLEKNKKMSPGQKEAALENLLNPTITANQNTPKLKEALGHVRNANNPNAQQKVSAPVSVSTAYPSSAFKSDAADAALASPPAKLFRTSASSNLRSSSQVKSEPPPPDTGPKKPGMR